MLRNTATGYGWVAITLHWTIGLIFIGQFVLGLVMTEITSQRTAFELIQLHKSFGFLLLGLVVLRIGWRLTSIRPALPRETGRLERLAAPLAHFALYLLQILVPLSGWALVSASVLEIPSMPFNLFVMPNLPLGISDGSEAFWGETHEILAYLAMALVALHVLAALRHHFWLKDAVLARMIAPFPGQSGNGRNIGGT